MKSIAYRMQELQHTLDTSDPYITEILHEKTSDEMIAMIERYQKELFISKKLGKDCTELLKNLSAIDAFMSLTELTAMMESDLAKNQTTPLNSMTIG